MPSGPAARRTQVERRSDAEDALLDAAADVVADRGVERASLASIGEGAGVSRGLPNHHFGSKDALIARLAERAQNQIDEATQAAVTPEERDPAVMPALELLKIAADTYLRRFESPTTYDQALIAMWGATFPRQASVEGMTDADQRAFAGWRHLIVQGQDDGSVRRDLDPLTGAVLIQSLLRGVAATLLTHAELSAADSLREVSVAWIETSLVAPGKPARR